jgi:hemerythrin-like domain-containing protein
MLYCSFQARQSYGTGRSFGEFGKSGVKFSQFEILNLSKQGFDMRIIKNLRKDQETILRFLDVFGGGSAALGASNKHAQPGFFIFANAFIQEYIEESFFQKENLLLKALENCGFPPDEGPTGGMRSEQAKSTKAAEILLKAAKDWQAGDEEARVDVGWAASEYSSTLRHHLDRLKNLVFPLLEQNISPEEEQKVAEGINNVVFESSTKGEADRFTKLIEALEEELGEWK